MYMRLVINTVHNLLLCANIITEAYLPKAIANYYSFLDTTEIRRADLPVLRGSGRLGARTQSKLVTDDENSHVSIQPRSLTYCSSVLIQMFLYARIAKLPSTISLGVPLPFPSFSSHVVTTNSSGPLVMTRQRTWIVSLRCE